MKSMFCISNSKSILYNSQFSPFVSRKEKLPNLMVVDLIDPKSNQWNFDILRHQLQIINIERVLVVSLSPIHVREAMLVAFQLQVYLIKRGYWFQMHFNKLQQGPTCSSFQGEVFEMYFWKEMWKAISTTFVIIGMVECKKLSLQ